jgi:hypothetical protein
LGAMLVRNGGFADVFITNGEPDDSLYPQGPHQRLGRIALVDELVKIAPLLNPERPVESERQYIQLESRVLNNHGRKEGGYVVSWQIYAFLLLINTPNVTTHTTAEPHRGLARKVLANRKVLGMFPLQAWTTITLTPGVVVEPEQERTITGPTGTKTLHWTRSHMRRIHGVWTLISDYWSGDGSLGIKRSRYKVEPPHEGDRK